MNYFSLEEMRCRDGTPYPDEFIADPFRWPRLLSTGNVVRETYGDKVSVISGYRSPPYNAMLRERSILRLIAKGRTREEAEKESGVAKESLHREGIAMDIRPSGMPDDPGLWTPEHFAKIDRFYRLIVSTYDAGNLPDLGGLGRYLRWVHIDVRKRKASGRLYLWDDRPAWRKKIAA